MTREDVKLVLKTAVVAAVAAFFLIWGWVEIAQAHDLESYDEWITGWEQRYEDQGHITVELILELSDFLDRHPEGRPAPTRIVSTGASSASGSGGSTSSYGAGAEQWRGLVASVWAAGLVDRALCVIDWESSGNPDAVNSSSGAAGLFQVMPFWWDHYGGDRFDPATNVSVAYLIYEAHGWTAWSAIKRGKC